MNDCTHMTVPLIVGLGSHHGDDQAGWLVIDRLQERGYPTSRLVRLRKPADLLDVFDAEQVVGWDQRRFAAPAHHDVVPIPTNGGPALEASLSHLTLSPLIICDACVGTGLPPGTIHRFLWPSDEMNYQRAAGSHDQSLADVIGLGQRFGCLPDAAEVWTITAGSWSGGSEPSQCVVLAAVQLADVLWKEFPSA